VQECGHVAAASLNLHMHHDVVANSVGDDELTAALLLAHEAVAQRWRR
jgi:hypothetical protein